MNVPLKSRFLTPTRVILIGILLLAAILRFWGLGAADMNSDDALNSFRSIGYFDFLAADVKQSTPVDWFSAPQWWQPLSFHDAPPVGFIIQHLFFKIFGVSDISARLPFALAGILAVWLAYLLGTNLYGKNMGLLAAGLMAVNNYAVWISRTGYLESLVILFTLCSLYFFLRAEKQPKYYLAWGLAMGLGIATKYTFIFVLPVFLLMLIIRKREAFKNWHLYAGLGLAAVILSPVAVYNLMMYLRRGHFDAALSSMLGMSPDDFRGLTRGLGGFHAGGLFQDIKNSSSLLTMIAAAAGSFWMVVRSIKDRLLSKHSLVLSYAFFVFLGLAILGSAPRFTSMTAPLLALLGAYAAAMILERILAKKGWKQAAFVLLAVWLAAETLFTFNTQVAIHPFGKPGLAYAEVRPKFEGYKQLDDYLSANYPGVVPQQLVTFYKSPQVVQYQKQIFEKMPEAGSEPILLIYDGRINWFAEIWLFERRKLYDIQASGTIQQFSEAINKYGKDYFTKLGFKKAVFIIAQNENVEVRDREQDAKIGTLQTMLRAVQPETIVIKNPAGQPAFAVYETAL